MCDFTTQVKAGQARLMCAAKQTSIQVYLSDIYVMFFSNTASDESGDNAYVTISKRIRFNPEIYSNKSSIENFCLCSLHHLPGRTHSGLTRCQVQCQLIKRNVNINYKAISIIQIGRPLETSDLSAAPIYSELGQIPPDVLDNFRNIQIYLRNWGSQWSLRWHRSAINIPSVVDSVQGAAQDKPIGQIFG